MALIFVIIIGILLLVAAMGPNLFPTPAYYSYSISITGLDNYSSAGPVDVFAPVPVAAGQPLFDHAYQGNRSGSWTVRLVDTEYGKMLDFHADGRNLSDISLKYDGYLDRDICYDTKMSPEIGSGVRDPEGYGIVIADYRGDYDMKYDGIGNMSPAKLSLRLETVDNDTTGIAAPIAMADTVFYPPYEVTWKPMAIREKSRTIGRPETVRYSVSLVGLGPYRDYDSAQIRVPVPMDNGQPLFRGLNRSSSSGGWNVTLVNDGASCYWLEFDNGNTSLADIDFSYREKVDLDKASLSWSPMDDRQMLHTGYFMNGTIRPKNGTTGGLRLQVTLEALDRCFDGMNRNGLHAGADQNVSDKDRGLSPVEAYSSVYRIC